jgi:hypothetical protein
MEKEIYEKCNAYVTEIFWRERSHDEIGNEIENVNENRWWLWLKFELLEECRILRMSSLGPLLGKVGREEKSFCLDLEGVFLRSGIVSMVSFGSQERLGVDVECPCLGVDVEDWVGQPFFEASAFDEGSEVEGLGVYAVESCKILALHDELTALHPNLEKEVPMSGGIVFLLEDDLHPPVDVWFEFTNIGCHDDSQSLHIAEASDFGIEITFCIYMTRWYKYQGNTKRSCFQIVMSCDGHGRLIAVFVEWRSVIIGVMRNLVQVISEVPAAHVTIGFLSIHMYSAQMKPPVSEILVDGIEAAHDDVDAEASLKDGLVHFLFMARSCDSPPCLRVRLKLQEILAEWRIHDVDIPFFIFEYVQDRK